MDRPRFECSTRLINRNLGARFVALRSCEVLSIGDVSVC